MTDRAHKEVLTSSFFNTRIKNIDGRIKDMENAIKNGDLNKVKNCVKITGYVNSTDDFKDQPKVINPASEILSIIFGEKGKHARAAVSTNSLPLGVAVEIDAIFEIN